MSTVRFDLPHALVTLTVTDTGGVEIEVWPKAGQSAYVVLPPDVARHVAGAMIQLAEEAEADEAEADEADREDVVADDSHEADPTDDDVPSTAPSNVYDLTSRRLARDRGGS